MSEPVLLHPALAFSIRCLADSLFLSKRSAGVPDSLQTPLTALARITMICLQQNCHYRHASLRFLIGKSPKKAIYPYPYNHI